MNGAITVPHSANRTAPKGKTRTVGYFWKRQVITVDTIDDVFDVMFIDCPPHKDGSVARKASRKALRPLVPMLEGRVVVMCGRGVEHILFAKNSAPYGAVRMLNLNSRMLTGEHGLPPALCTTVIAPHPSPNNQPRITRSPHQAKRLEFGMIYRRSLTLKHRPPRTL